MTFLYLIFKDTLFDNFQDFMDWMIAHPIEGSLYFFMLYIVGIPLTFPLLILVIFGAYAFTQIYGKLSKYWRYLKVYIDGLIIFCSMNFIFCHLGLLVAFFIGRYIFRDVI